MQQNRAIMAGANVSTLRTMRILCVALATARRLATSNAFGEFAREKSVVLPPEFYFREENLGCVIVFFYME